MTSAEAAEIGRKGGLKKKPATLIAQMFRDALAKKVHEESDEWIKSMRDLALGLYTEVRDEEGNVVSVYRKPPNHKAWVAVLDRAFGKPKQPVEFENPLEVDILSKRGQYLLNELKKHENGKANTKGVAGDDGKGKRSGEAGVDQTVVGSKE